MKGRRNKKKEGRKKGRKKERRRRRRRRRRRKSRRKISSLERNWSTRWWEAEQVAMLTLTQRFGELQHAVPSTGCCFAVQALSGVFVRSVRRKVLVDWTLDGNAASCVQLVGCLTHFLTKWIRLVTVTLL